MNFIKGLFASEDGPLIGGGLAMVIQSGFNLHDATLWGGLGMVAKGLISIIFGVKA